MTTANRVGRPGKDKRDLRRNRIGACFTDYEHERLFVVLAAVARSLNKSAGDTSWTEVMNYLVDHYFERITEDLD